MWIKIKIELLWSQQDDSVVTVLAGKPGDLSLIPEMHENMEGEKWLHRVVLWPSHGQLGTYVHMHTQPWTDTQNNHSFTEILLSNWQRQHAKLYSVLSCSIIGTPQILTGLQIVTFCPKVSRYTSWALKLELLIEQRLGLDIYLVEISITKVCV